MQYVNERGTTRRAMLRAGAAAGTAAALGGAGLFAAGAARAATAAGSGTRRGLPYPSGVTDTSHCTPEAAEIFRGIFTAKSEHDTAAFMSYFSTADTCYIDASLGIRMSSWQEISTEFTQIFANAPADAISYPLTITGDTRSAAIEFVDTPAFFGKEIRALSSVTFDTSRKIIRWVDYWDGRSSLLPNAITAGYPAGFSDSAQNAGPAVIQAARYYTRHSDSSRTARAPPWSTSTAAARAAATNGQQPRTPPRCAAATLNGER